MELKPGYKQTEVGVIPEDWAVAQFNNVTDLITCGIAATPKYVSEAIGYPFLSSTNVKNGRVLWCDYKHIDPQQHRQLYKNNPPRKGDVLYSRVGTIGEAAVIDSEAEFSIYVSLTLIKPKRSLDSNFLAHLLNSSPYKQRARDQVYLGGGVGNLNVEVVRRYPIPIPSVSEQQAIATALSDADALIEALEQLLAKKRQIKQGAMQELLTGQRRLPGFAGEWDVKRLGDVIEKFVGGGTPSRSNSDYWGDEIPWVTVKDFATFNPRHSQEAITKTGLHNSASHLIPSGTLITSTRMALGRAVIYEVDVAINQDLKALFPKSVLDTRYLYFWFQYHGQEIDELGSGSTVKGISLPELKKIEFRLPLRSEQTAIAAVLSDMDAEIATLEAKLAKARSVKQGMMQELLTGRIRLVEPEKAAA